MIPLVEQLAATWRSIDELCTGLSEDDWKRPTGCPGWSVQDNLSHLIDYESFALGRPRPEHEVGPLPHTKNDMGVTNEVGVDARRSRPGAEVLAEFRDVTAERLAHLSTFTEDDLTREVTTPIGPGTMKDMLTLRVMDTWSHEQDIRRALGRPGHEDDPAVATTVAYFTGFMPFVIGKRAGAPEGSTVVVAVDRQPPFAVQVIDGRATAVAVPEDPTVTLHMGPVDFDALVCGRADARPDAVQIIGDEALGKAVVAGLGFMP